MLCYMRAFLVMLEDFNVNFWHFLPAKCRNKCTTERFLNTTPTPDVDLLNVDATAVVTVRWGLFKQTTPHFGV